MKNVTEEGEGSRCREGLTGQAPLQQNPGSVPQLWTGSSLGTGLDSQYQEPTPDKSLISTGWYPTAGQEWAEEQGQDPPWVGGAAGEGRERTLYVPGAIRL